MTELMLTSLVYLALPKDVRETERAFSKQGA